MVYPFRLSSIIFFCSLGQCSEHRHRHISGSKYPGSFVMADIMLLKQQFVFPGGKPAYAEIQHSRNSHTHNQSPQQHQNRIAGEI